MEIDYSLQLPDIPADTLIRCLILLWSGDYPAQCEVGKSISGGKRACRREKLVGEF